MRISIVMTTYNGENYILEQLNSLYNQNRKPDEVLIFDDGSTDSTVSVINRFITENKCDNWKLTVNGKNKGWRKNFMVGIWNASGDLIFPCDQDDIWHADKLEKMEQIMINNQEISVLVSNCKNFYEDGSTKIMPKRNDGKLEKVEIKKNCMTVDYPGCTYCIRRQLAQLSKKYYSKEYAHDDFIWRLGLFSGSLYSINEDLIDYRRHKDSTYSIEVVGMKTIAEKKKWLSMTESCVEDLSRFVVEQNFNNKNEALQMLEKVKLWVMQRTKLYNSQSIWQAIRMIKYINYYQRKRQYLGDWYIIFFNRK